MGIVACCANAIVMSEEGRLAMSGPEVIETANGVEEFDSRDRALVWRTTGGKHRYLMGDCDMLVPDKVDAFRQAASDAIERVAQGEIALSLTALEQEHTHLQTRVEQFGQLSDPLAIWAQLGIADPDSLAMLEIDQFLTHTAAHRAHHSAMRVTTASGSTT
jgi:malonate decarboxylase beta subunit